MHRMQMVVCCRNDVECHGKGREQLLRLGTVRMDGGAVDNLENNKGEITSKRLPNPKTSD